MSFGSIFSKSIKWWYFVIIGIIILDLVTKAIFDGKVLGFIPGFISIAGTVHNTGASYGMFSGQSFAQVMFIILALLFASALIAFDLFYKKPFKKNVWYKLAFVLLLGGLFGNLIDRMTLGYVRDFVQFDFISFPVFNLADVALTCGCISFIIYVIFCNPFEALKETNQEQTTNQAIKTVKVQDENKKEEIKQDEQRKSDNSKK